jgi:hypothetical protein
MHNGRLANPLDPFSQALAELTKVRKKTEATYREIQKIEWFGSLYQDEDGVIAIPADNIISCLKHAARKFSKGKEVQAGVFETRPYFRLGYSGPKDPKKLFANGKFLDTRLHSVKTSKVLRSVPKFDQWSVSVSLQYDEDLINPREMEEFFSVGGERIGLLEYRPRYGRFSAEESK